MAKVNIPKIKLNDGREMPALGYGTWLGLDNKLEFDMTDVDKLIDTMSYAIDIGYRHIDTAHLYRVEPEVGQVVNQKIQEGVVKREDMFITTKVWQTYHREAAVQVSIENSLRRLNMDYVDLVLMHWPMSYNTEGVDEKIDYLETWRGFEKALERGLTKSIGVSNFNMEQLQRLLDNCHVKPVCNQVEINLNLGQKELVDFCQSQKIVIVAYSPFGTMIPTRNFENSPEPKLDNPIMMAIAKKHGKTVTQIALRYLYERGIVPIPKTVTRSRVLENASVFDFSLDAHNRTQLASFDVGYRTVQPVFFQKYTHYPFDIVDSGHMENPVALIRWKNGAKLDID